MGKRGPKKGQGGRRISRKDPAAKIERLQMQRTRASKQGDIEKAESLTKNIEAIKTHNPTYLENLKSTIANYQGRRKEIYDNLMIAVVDGLAVSTFREKQRTEFIAKLNQAFDEKITTIPFNIDDFKPLFLKHFGFSWEQLTAKEQTELLPLFEQKFKEMTAKTREDLKKEEMPDALLQYDIMQLEHIIEGVELKFQLENNSNALDSKIHGIVKSTLWDALVDDVTNKVKKELSK